MDRRDRGRSRGGNPENATSSLSSHSATAGGARGGACYRERSASPDVTEYRLAVSSSSIADPAQVRVNLYDLGPALSVLNGFLLSSLNSGIFHVAVEAYGLEWSFAYLGEERNSHCPNNATTGVLQSKPRKLRNYLFRESLEIGRTPLSEEEAQREVRRLCYQWRANSYHITRRNCVGFCETLVERLGLASQFPTWLRNVYDVSNSSSTLSAMVDHSWAAAKRFMLPRQPACEDAAEASVEAPTTALPVDPARGGLDASGAVPEVAPPTEESDNVAENAGSGSGSWYWWRCTSEPGNGTWWRCYGETVYGDRPVHGDVFEVVRAERRAMDTEDSLVMGMELEDARGLSAGPWLGSQGALPGQEDGVEKPTTLVQPAPPAFRQEPVLLPSQRPAAMASAYRSAVLHFARVDGDGMPTAWALTVEFEAWGDMSLGPIDSPRGSRLCWHGGHAYPKNCHYTHDRRRNSQASSIAGSLTFAAVPRRRTLFFQFGSEEYSAVELPATLEAAPVLSVRRPPVKLSARRRGSTAKRLFSSSGF